MFALVGVRRAEHRLTVDRVLPRRLGRTHGGGPQSQGREQGQDAGECKEDARLLD
ncbi:hypothetical protein R3P82_05805 [Dietzia maris]|uniref:Uncharacterized protein n=1 Tax=Dietzia maris TaxID=37915 RepID=A0AAE4QWC4_9ACTN|nr:hypothetical protein [Dietzia maris]MDV6298622.1 hypothetical protein [Dietzia maris]